jgi:hypothetical protein
VACGPPDRTVRVVLDGHAFVEAGAEAEGDACAAR